MSAKTDAQSPQLSRRSFCKTVGFGVGAAAVGASGSTSALADDDDEAWYEDWKLDATTAYYGGPGTWAAYSTYKTADATGSLAESVIDWWVGDSNELDLDNLRNLLAHDSRQYFKQMMNTVVMTENVLEYAIQGIFTDAKIEAIKTLEDSPTSQEFEDAAVEVGLQNMTVLDKTIVEAAIAGWKMLHNYHDQAVAADLDPHDLIRNGHGGANSSSSMSLGDDEETELLDGTPIDIPTVVTDDRVHTPIKVPGVNSYQGLDDSSRHSIRVMEADGETAYPPIPTSTTMADIPEAYNDTDHDLQTTREKIHDEWEHNLEPNIKTWCANAYDALQAGDIDVEALWSPSMTAEVIAEEEPTNMALTHLRSSGVAVDPEHAVDLTITGPQNTTVYADSVLLASTADTGTVAEGSTIDPDEEEDDYMMNHFPEDISAEWTHYEDDVDGGYVTLTETPRQILERYLTEDMSMVVTTIEDESAVLDPLEHGDRQNPEQPFEVYIGDQLEDAITQVESITIYAEIPEQATDRNLMLERPFTVDAIDGLDELEFERDRELQEADNYLTEEEWQDFLATQQEIIDAMEDDGGGGTGIGWPDFGASGGLIGGVIVLVGGLWALTAFGGSD